MFVLILLPIIMNIKDHKSDHVGTHYYTLTYHTAEGEADPTQINSLILTYSFVLLT